jgi:hypothetical protein
MFGPHFSEYQTPIPSAIIHRQIHVLANTIEFAIMVSSCDEVMVAASNDEVRTGDSKKPLSLTSRLVACA